MGSSGTRQLWFSIKRSGYLSLTHGDHILLDDPRPLGSNLDVGTGRLYEPRLHEEFEFWKDDTDGRRQFWIENMNIGQLRVTAGP